MNSSGYQGYGGGGGYYGGGGAQQQQQQQQQPSMFSTNQYGQPMPQQQQPGQFSQQRQQQQGSFGQQQQGNFSQQPQQGGFGQPQQQQGGYGFNQQSQQQPSVFGQPQQQQQQQQAPNLWNPAMSAAAMGMVSSLATGQGLPNEMLASEAKKVGEQFFQTSIFPGFHTFMIMLRSYFAVDNRYVMLKMKRVLFPFISKHWKRNLKGNVGPDPGSATYDLPIADENAPDLYIPFMSLITYVLLCAICYGNAGQFDPEVIPDVTTKCVLAQILEVVAIRVGFYMMQTSVPFLDLWAYTGYKYLGLCINISVALVGRLLTLGGTTTYYVCFLWTASAAAYLMLKIMSHTVPMQVAAQGPKREVMVLAFAACQPVFMWFVSQTKFL